MLFEKIRRLLLDNRSGAARGMAQQRLAFGDDEESGVKYIEVLPG
jgi:hypothetical protein